MKPGYPSFLDRKQVAALDELLAWVEEVSPAERHFLSYNWNWDYGVAPLQAIADREDSALETVAHIYAIGNATDYLIEPAEAALAEHPGSRPDNAEVFRLTLDYLEKKNDPYFKQARLDICRLLVTIISKAASGAYPRVGYASNSEPETGGPFELPPRLIGPFKGQNPEAPDDPLIYDLLEKFGLHFSQSVTSLKLIDDNKSD